MHDVEAHTLEQATNTRRWWLRKSSLGDISTSPLETDREVKVCHRIDYSKDIGHCHQRYSKARVSLQQDVELELKSKTMSIPYFYEAQLGRALTLGIK